MRSINTKNNVYLNSEETKILYMKISNLIKKEITGFKIKKKITISFLIH